MFSKEETFRMLEDRKAQIRDRIIKLLDKDKVASRTDVVEQGIADEKYLYDHPEIMEYFHQTLINMVEGKYKVDLTGIDRPGFFNKKGIEKAILLAKRRDLVVKILERARDSDFLPSIRGVALEIGCSPSYLRASGLSKLVDQVWREYQQAASAA